MGDTIVFEIDRKRSWLKQDYFSDNKTTTSKTKTYQSEFKNILLTSNLASQALLDSTAPRVGKKPSLRGCSMSGQLSAI